MSNFEVYKHKLKMTNETINLNTENSAKENMPSQNASIINVKISDVLTPLTCATLVNEIFKGLIYQKCQIPYPYTWLKSVVDKKRRENNIGDEKKMPNFTLVNHFRVVSNAYDTLENVMKAIVKEFSENATHIKEIIFLFGTTPQSPKEVFTINLTSVAEGHLERNHASYINKFQQKVLRNIFLSQNWLDAVDATTTCTNTYIFLRKSTPDANRCTSGSDNFFIPSKPLTLSSKIRHIKINLNYEGSANINCCNNLSVFEDGNEGDALLKRTVLTDSAEFEKSVLWYQSKDLFKGFKDCYINKVPASELW